MRILLAILCAILGMLAGWAGIAALVIGLAGLGGDGGSAMGAVFEIGPIGGLVGLVVGVTLFLKFGLVYPAAPSPDTAAAGATPLRSRVSRPFAIGTLLVTVMLGGWGWYEFIRSPYLSDGFMTLALQFRLPPGTQLPLDRHDVDIDVAEGDQHSDVYLQRTAWLGHDGPHPVILAFAPIMYKTSRRVVTLSVPGLPTQSWTLDLASDPHPMRGFSPWRASNQSSAGRIEMDFRLEAGH